MQKITNLVTTPHFFLGIFANGLGTPIGSGGLREPFLSNQKNARAGYKPTN